MRPWLVALAALTQGCEVPVVRFECAGGEPLCERRQPAAGIDVDAVAVYQGVEVWVVGGDDAVAPPTLVAGRDALFRVFASPRDGWEALDPADRAVTAKLELFDGGAFVRAIEADVEISGPSEETDLDSTFNITVPGGLLTETSSWRVRLLGGGGDLVVGEAELPADGETEPLEALPGADLVRIALVPVEYNGDGSGRLPDTSETMVEAYRSWAWRIYPAAEVEVEVMEPLPSSQRVQANGTGWTELLAEVTASRTGYGVGDDVYLYGLFAPSDSFSQFCAAGCIAGLSNMAMSAGDAWSRASIGLGYSDETMAQTMVHEVGHAQGRYHVDCGGATGTDPDYPYDGSTTGVRGYDLVAGALREADQYADFMGYCWPIWTSDYTYDALFERIVAVNALASADTARLEAERWQVVWVHPDGRVRRAPDRLLRGPPGGLPDRVEIVGNGGDIVSVEAFFSPFDHLAGGVLVFRAPDGPVEAVRYRGVTAD